MRRACCDANNVSFGDHLRLAILNAASLCLAIAIGFCIYHAAAGDQIRLSLRNKKDVVVMRVYFGTAAGSPYGKLNCVRFVVAECCSTAARAFGGLHERHQLRSDALAGKDLGTAPCLRATRNHQRGDCKNERQSHHPS